MKQIVTIIILTHFTWHLSGQVEISGIVKDRSGDQLAGVNIYFEGSYDGSTTNRDGIFSFTTDLKGEHIIVASYIGFNTFRESILLEEKAVKLSITLKESANSLDAVVITAGSFEASDEKKAVIFKPLDIATTAGGLADIPSAINTLPGTQTVGEEGKLFVRGGDSYETRTFVDGMVVDKPYESTMPDIPSRGMFSPFLFKGTIFSSGGYSAEYGQALSSALILQTNDLPAESVTSLSFMSVGLGASQTKKWEKTSLAASIDYFNLSPYFYLVDQHFDWQKAPNGINGTLTFRQKTGKDGLIKVYGQMGTGKSKLNYPGYADVSKTNPVQLKNDNAYLNSTFRDIHNDNLISNAGISYTFSNDNYNISGDRILEGIRNLQIRYNMTWLATETIKVKYGGELWSRNYSQDFLENNSVNEFSTSFNDNISAGFIETEMKVSKHFALRAGARGEYSDYLRQSVLAPRLSMACKTGKNSQLSIAYGKFYQSPHKNYLLFTDQLRNESAVHYIANYQITANKRTFRAEIYFKDYDNLVKYDSLYLPDPQTYNNQGSGYAKGIDIFYRDKSIHNIDYWISYSYIDTKRNYRDFVRSATPTFVSDHNLSVVYKQYIPAISSQVGLTYKFASGRPYFNPESNGFLSDRTKAYNDLSFNISYLTTIWDNFTILYFSVGNILGIDQTFGYRYSLNPDSEGNYESYEIKPGAKRFLFLGVFVSI